MLVWIGSAVAAVVVVMSPAAASALEPGVHVNPNSPAGIEYAFPLGSARAGLSGQPPGSSPGATSASPLFGVGVHPDATRPRRTGAHRQRQAKPSARPDAADAQARKLESKAAAGSVGDLVLLLAGGVVLAGVLGGLLGTRLRRQTVAT